MDISTVRARSKISVNANAIHWRKITLGRYIGFRKTSAVGGTWWARSRDKETDKQHFKNLGDYGHLPDHERFSAASVAAGEWFRDLDVGVRPDTAATVRGACEHYVQSIRETGAERKASEAEARIKRLVYADPIANLPLSKLRAAHVADWKARLVALPAKVSRSSKKNITRERARSTVNRDIVALRAALNLAHARGLVATDIAWRAELKPFSGANKRREIYLSRAERKKLLEKADKEIQPFLRALALLPLRPGALAARRVADFDRRLRTLIIADDKGHTRRITLPAETSAFLVSLCKDKLPNAPLIGRVDGRHWNKDAWKKPIKQAVSAAALPLATTAYALRHSTITDLVKGGVDLLTVAQLSGTSVAMIEKHYGHLDQRRGAQALAALSL